MKKENLLLENLVRDNLTRSFKNIVDDVEKCGYKDKRKGEYVSMLTDYLFLGCDREDHLDDDIVKLYIHMEIPKQKELLIMYLIDGNSIEYVNRDRGFGDGQFKQLIEMIDPEEKPLGTMVVCARCWLNEVMKGRLEFKASDFISVIEFCRGKELDIY